MTASPPASRPAPEHPIFTGIQIGTGTWAWGDRLLWGFGDGYNETDIRAAFDASLSSGIQLFDTAEGYGQGRSEKYLGEFIQGQEPRPVLATKFMPYPWRLSRARLLEALRNSLQRLGVEKVQLYQVHYPMPPVPVETWMEAMAEALEAGLTDAVGVSNFSRTQMQRANQALLRRGARLASNQVEYSLLHRQPEKSGLLRDCQQMGIRLIAYSPLGMGLLTGKYDPRHAPQGLRLRRTGRNTLTQIQPLVALLRKIGAAHDGKTPAQVALNWVICKGALPIPGAKNDQQAAQNAGALGWRLNDDEVAALDEASDGLSRS